MAQFVGEVEALVLDLGLEFADTITRDLIIEEVVRRGYDTTKGEEVAQYLGY